MKIPEKYIRKMPPFDALTHYFHDTCLTANYPFRETGLLCVLCGHPLTYAYHEERLYSVHCKTCETITVTAAGSPEQAARIAGGITKMNNEVRLIDANALKETIQKMRAEYKAVNNPDGACAMVLAAKAVELQPTIEAEPVRHSSKIPVETVDECKAVLLDHLCTECGSLCTDTDKYCAECGAKTDGGE